MAAVNFNRSFYIEDNRVCAPSGQSPLEEKGAIPEEESKENESLNGQEQNRYYEWKNSGIPQPGPLLEVARKFSRRVYELYKIYCAYEIERGNSFPKNLFKQPGLN